MKCFYFLLLLIMPLFQPATAQACGYGFVGGCSTNIGLRINGTADSFAIAPCPGNTRLEGLRLGTIQSMDLIGAHSINWESCQNNVTSVILYFRVFETGTPGGAWQTLTLQENYYTLVGPYTTRYRSANGNVNLTDGLIIGKDYTLETYFRAEIDTIGDDFIPETFLLQNNEGANFHLNFRYGGPSAPPFTVVETRKSPPTCYGDSTGTVGVTVYGNQTGLFYNWNTGNNNYFALYDLPAGTYLVTVTGAGGYSQVDTIVLEQPPAITNQFTNLVALGCNNGAGEVTAQPGGGAGPYSYYWNNGQTSPTLTTTTIGNFTLTVTDSQACSQSFSQFIPGGNAPIIQYFTAEICSGASYQFNNQLFTQSGNYQFTLPGVSGCDTVVNLQLTVWPALTVTSLVQMASGPQIANGSAMVEVAGGTFPYTFQWSTGSTSPTMVNLLPGSYCFTVTDAHDCSHTDCVEVSYSNAVTEPAVGKIALMPNPVSPGDLLTLQLTDRYLGEQVEIEILDVVGRRYLLENQRATSTLLRIPVPVSISPGLLLVRVRSAVGQSIGRCVAR